MAIGQHPAAVKARLPGPARAALDRGTLCYLAVRTSHGPHLTPVVYVLDGGRIWLTTARTSVKARALRRDRDVAGMVRVDGEAVTFRGRARTYDALDPLSWPSAAAAGPRLVRAATRFSLKNARFFAGYAVDAHRVPLAWSPPGRVFVAIEIDSGALLDLAGGRVADVWGAWQVEGEAVRLRSSYAPIPARRSMDLRVPRSVRSVVGKEGEGAAALDGQAQSVLPVRWHRVAREGAYQAILPDSFLGLGRPSHATSGRSHLRAALTVDRLAAWRAAEMAGMLLQGDGEVFSPHMVRRGREALRTRLEAVRRATAPSGEPDPWAGADLALIRLRPNRVVWWQGWSSGTASEP